MKKSLTSLLVLLTAAFFCGCATICGEKAAPPQPATIHLVGDSTCASYPASRAPLTGWGQVLNNYVNPAYGKVNNQAYSGYSTNSYIYSGRWDRLMKQLKPGDFVVIQFGHNDGGAKKNTKRYADVKTAYPANLTRFVKDVRARKANPILVTSIAKCIFREGKVTPNYLLKYRDAMMNVAKNENVPLIDINTITITQWNKIGEKAAYALYLGPVYTKVKPGSKDKPKFRYDDRTHLSVNGAHEVAKMFVKACKEQKLPIAEYFK